MNENSNYNSGNIRPYKASGNLNTTIGNPSVNINDTMNVNIQSMNTSNTSVSNNQNYSNGIFKEIIPNCSSNSQIDNPTNNAAINNNSVMSNTAYQANISDNGVSSTSLNAYQTTTVKNNNANNQGSYVNKTYVTTDNKPKKKSINLNLGPEFKTALLIVVVLLVFIFLLPMLYDFLTGR